MKKLLLIVLALLLPCAAEAANVTLAWDAVTDPGLAGYRLYHSAVSGGPYTLAGEVALVTSWTHTGLADGTHCWVATAFDTSQNESGYSNQVCLQDLDTTSPPAPGSLRVGTVVK